MDSYTSGFSHGYTTNNQNIGYYITGNSHTTNGAMVTQGANVDVTQLKQGDAFQGEIVSVNGEDVQILLNNGAYMAARLERDVQIALGQMLNFQVQSNKDNKIVLKILSATNQQLQRVGATALKAANLVVNDKNLQMVSKMIENGMPIDKSTLNTLNRLVLQHPQANVLDIINMMKLKLPITDANIEQFRSYQNLEYKLLDSTKEVADEILKTYDTLLENNNVLSNSGISTTIQGVVNANKFMEQIMNLLSEVNVETSKGVQNTSQIINESTVAVSKEDIPMANNADDTSIILQNSKNETNVSEQKISANLNNLNETIATKELITSNSLNDIFDKVADSIKMTPVSDIGSKIIGMIEHGDIDEKVINKLFKENELVKNLLPELKKQIFESEPFKELVKKSIQNRWSLEPSEIAQEGKVQDFYEKIVKDLRKISQFINDSVMGDTQDIVHTKAINNVRNNLDFMNQINQMFNYIQLPLKLTNSQAHGDLYVYANKKHLASDDGSLTAFMHLDMENLGSVDVSITLRTDKNMITTKFYIEEDSIKLIEEHIDELSKRLYKKGYQSVNIVEKVEQAKSVLQHLEKNVLHGNIRCGYQTFDTRA